MDSISSFSAFAGSKTTVEGIDRAGIHSVGSGVGAGNNISFNAGANMNIIGSGVSADNNIELDAHGNINIQASFDTETLKQYAEEIMVGVTLAARQNVTGTTQTVINLPKDASAGYGGPGYQAATAAGAILRAVDSVIGTFSEVASVSATGGASYSQNAYNAAASTANPSLILARGNLYVFADNDLNISGSHMFSGKDTFLGAGNNMNITSAQSGGEADFSSFNAAAGGGLKAGIGSGSPAAGVNIYASAGGSASGNNYSSHLNSNVFSGGNLFIYTGNNATVIGAHLEGERVYMDIGGNLTVASPQDTSSSHSNYWNAGANVTFGYGANVAVNLGYGQGSGNSAWTGDQTTIIGRTGFDGYVEGNTHLKGGILAALNDNLYLDTNTLTYEAVYDHNRGQNWGASISASHTFAGGFAKDATIGGIPVYNYNNGKNSNTPYVPDSGSLQLSGYDQQGILRPTVGAGKINVRSNPSQDFPDLNRELGRAREITEDDSFGMDFYISKGSVEAVAAGTVWLIETIVEFFANAGNKLSANQRNAFETKYKEELCDKLGNALSEEAKLKLAESFGTIAAERYSALRESGLSHSEAMTIVSIQTEYLIYSFAKAVKQGIVVFNADGTALIQYSSDGMAKDLAPAIPAFITLGPEAAASFLTAALFISSGMLFIELAQAIRDGRKTYPALDLESQANMSLALGSYEYRRLTSQVLVSNPDGLDEIRPALVVGVVDNQQIVYDYETGKYFSINKIQLDYYMVGEEFLPGVSGSIESFPIDPESGKPKILVNIPPKIENTPPIYVPENGNPKLPGYNEGEAPPPNIIIDPLPEPKGPELLYADNIVPVKKLEDLSMQAQNIFAQYEKNGWKGNVPNQTPGTAAGSTYHNTPNPQSMLLPTHDLNGIPITYKEFDVNNKIAGSARDAERFVVGSDNSIYYTKDHYTTFFKVK